MKTRGKMYRLDKDFYPTRYWLASILAPYLLVRNFDTIHSAWLHYTQDTDPSAYNGTWFTMQSGINYRPHLYYIHVIRDYTSMITNLHESDGTPLDTEVKIGEIPKHRIKALLKNPEY